MAAAASPPERIGKLATRVRPRHRLRLLLRRLRRLLELLLVAMSGEQELRLLLLELASLLDLGLHDPLLLGVFALAFLRVPLRLLRLAPGPPAFRTFCSAAFVFCSSSRRRPASRCSRASFSAKVAFSRFTSAADNASTSDAAGGDGVDGDAATAEVLDDAPAAAALPAFARANARAASSPDLNVPRFAYCVRAL